MAPSAGRPKKKLGKFAKKKTSSNGRDCKAERAAKKAKVTDLRPDDEQHDVRDDEVPATTAQHVQVEADDERQDTITCEDTTFEDYKDNHFLMAKVKEELGNFFDRKEEAKIICVVYLFVSVHNANPDESTWCGKKGIISKIRKGMELPAKAQLDYILQDALEH
jgi:hypothetical protein